MLLVSAAVTRQNVAWEKVLIVVSALSVSYLIYYFLKASKSCHTLSLCVCVCLYLQFLVRASGLDSSLTLPFTVPTVTSMTSLLRQGEGLFNNPHHVVLVLGALQSVPLDHLSPPVYQAAFLAVHEALFAIIQCHTQVGRDRRSGGFQARMF